MSPAGSSSFWSSVNSIFIPGSSSVTTRTSRTPLCLTPLLLFFLASHGQFPSESPSHRPNPPGENADDDGNANKHVQLASPRRAKDGHDGEEDNQPQSPQRSAHGVLRVVVHRAGLTVSCFPRDRFGPLSMR